MKNISVKISEETDSKLSELSEKVHQKKSELIRTAIQEFLQSRNKRSFLRETLKSIELIDGPSDLSANKDYLKNFGK